MSGRKRGTTQSSVPHVSAARRRPADPLSEGRSEAAADASGVQDPPAAEVQLQPEVGDQEPVLRRIRELMELMAAFRCGSDGHATVASVTEVELQNSGLSAADLVDLLNSGFVAYHRPSRFTSSWQVRAGPPELAPAALGDRVTPLELTSAGAALLRRMSQLVDGTLQEQPTMRLRPVWRARQRELWYGDVLVKRMRRAAPNQELVLAVFEEEGWPPRIDDPLPRDYEQVPATRLHNTINRLNSHMQAAAIRFGGDGAASGFCWHPR